MLKAVKLRFWDMKPINADPPDSNQDAFCKIVVWEKLA
jgi:hypothetical protein